MNISKNNLLKCFCAFVSLLVTCALPIGNSNVFFFIVVITISNTVPLIVSSFRKRNFLYLVFVSLLFELFLVMIFLIFIVKMPETSWRVKYVNDLLSYQSLNYISISLLTFASVYYISDFKNRNFEQYLKKIQISKSMFYTFCLVIVFFMFLFVIKGNFISIRNYQSSGSSILISIYRMVQAVFIILVAFGETYETKMFKIVRNTIFSVFIFLDITIGFLGYRFILVEALFLIVSIYFSKKEKIRFRNIFKLVLFGLVAYIILSVIRNTAIYRGNLLESFFRHERNIFYSLNAIIQNKPIEPPINTYANTILNLFPQSFSNAIDANTGRILIQYIDFDIYTQDSLTMGGFFLSEAVFNYGFLGIIIVSGFLSSFFTFLERKLDRNTMKTKLLYFFIAAQMYSVLYYGSSNYLKIIIFYYVFVILYLLIQNSMFEKYNTLSNHSL